MPIASVILISDLIEIISSIYAKGNPVVKESHSELNSFTRIFCSEKELIDDLLPKIQVPKGSESYAIYYPDTKGYVGEKTIHLDPTKFGAHTYRFCQQGWGLIFIHCYFQDVLHVKCNVSVNSPERAKKWHGIYPELKSPDLWDWNVVKQHARRLMRLLRKLEKNSRE